MRLTGLRLVVLAALALVLAACDQNIPKTVVIYTSTTGSYKPLQSVARSGNSVPVYAYGTPFMSDEGLAQSVAGWLAQKDPNLRFEGGGAALPWDSMEPRILILNDMPNGYSGLSACDGKPYEPIEAEDTLTFNIIVCAETDLLVQVMGILPKGIDNPTAEYKDLIRQTLRTVLIKEDRSPK